MTRSIFGRLPGFAFLPAVRDQGAHPSLGSLRRNWLLARSRHSRHHLGGALILAAADRVFNLLPPGSGDEVSLHG